MRNDGGLDSLPDNQGSTGSFDANWRQRPESLYNHWTPGRPSNQIQLAFRNHWTLFQEYLGARPPGQNLEVGCGRGSISSYFAQHGHDCTLLDYSQSVLETADQIFRANGHRATMVRGDANALPFEDDSFDSVVSIGLLEHFDDIATPLREQVRILKPGGRFFGYIVPERPDNVQRHFSWVNQLLALAAGAFGAGRAKQAKAEVYRSDLDSSRYLAALEGQPVQDVEVMGMYPLPMISHSPEFPFSLLPKPLEWTLTRLFEGVLAARRRLYGRHPWVCAEPLGQAFLVTFRKRA